MPPSWKRLTRTESVSALKVSSKPLKTRAPTLSGLMRSVYSSSDTKSANLTPWKIWTYMKLMRKGWPNRGNLTKLRQNIMRWTIKQNCNPTSRKSWRTPWKIQLCPIFKRQETTLKRKIRKTLVRVSLLKHLLRKRLIKRHRHSINQSSVKTVGPTNQITILFQGRGREATPYQVNRFHQDVRHSKLNLTNS